MLPNFKEIAAIGEKVTKFVQWGTDALTAIARNQGDLFRVQSAMAADMKLIKQHLGIEGNHDGNNQRIDRIEGSEFQPGNGGISGSGDGNSKRDAA